MSMGPLPALAASVSGSPLAQTKGSDVERAQHETANKERRVQNDLRAENAAGIGETDGDDHETADRDADGRSPWRIGRRAQKAEEPGESEEERRGKDATGRSGTILDLSG